MITIDTLDDDLPQSNKPARVDTTKSPGKGRRSPQADQSPGYKRGSLFHFLVRLFKKNDRES